MEKVEVQSSYVVLCVDDDPDSRAVFEEAASSLGYTPVGYATVAEAVDYILHHHNKIVLVLLDYDLGDGQSGLDVRRQTLAYSEIPFAVISGYVNKKMTLEGIACKLEIFLDKPLDMSVFRISIENAVNARKSDLDFKDEVKTMFLEEVEGLLDELEGNLLALETSPNDVELFNSVFRIVHTVKGSSAVLDTDDVRKYAHKFEDFLHSTRANGQTPSASDFAVCLGGLDGLKSLIASAVAGNPPPTTLPSFSVDKGSRPTQQEADNGGDADDAQRVTADKQQGSNLVKVPLHVLDRLEHHTAEVTIQKNIISKLISSLQRELPMHAGIHMLAGFFDEMVKHHALTRSEMQKIRTTPFSDVVRPLTRLVRDLEKSLGKNAELNVVGGQTLVDSQAKKLMSECFVHLIRNCMDHGIEGAEERIQKSKAERSEIAIEARENGQSIEIIIRDDGRGIDPDRVRDKALVKGLLPKDELQLLSDAQVIDLIFEPGFSTAEQISDTSGRGVGMDMVRTSLGDIGGSVSVTSQKDVGTTIRLLIPKQDLALSINSLLVRDGQAIYAISQQAILRLCDIKASGSIQVVEHEGVLSVDAGDRLLPMVSLAAFLRGEPLGLELSDFEDDRSIEVLILKDQEGPPFALCVDEILDIEEVVIRPVSRYIDKYNIYKGAALLNNGCVGLILDIAGVASYAGIGDSGVSTPVARAKEVFAARDAHFLLVEDEGGGKFAIRQEDIFRVETIAERDVKKTAGRSVYNYRNHIAKISSLAIHLGLPGDGMGSPPIVEARGVSPGVVVKGAQGFYVYTVGKIIDVVAIAENSILQSVTQDARFRGHVFIGVDMYSIVASDALSSSAWEVEVLRTDGEYSEQEVSHG